MRAFFSPALQLMDRLRYPYKFAVIGLLAAVVIAYLLYLQSIDTLKTIDVTRQELAGLAVDRPLLGLVQAVQQQRNLAFAVVEAASPAPAQHTAPAPEVQQHLAQVDAALAQHASRLGPQPRWAEAQAQWAQLQQQAPTLTDSARFQAHTRLVHSLLRLLRDVNDSSKLILDPDPESYNLMDAVTMQLPEALEQLAQLCTLGQQAQRAGLDSAVQRAQVQRAVVLLDADAQTLSAVLARIAADVPSLSRAVQGFDKSFQQTLALQQRSFQADVRTVRFDASAQATLAGAIGTVDAGYVHAQSVLLPALELLLRERIVRTQQQIVLGITATMVFLVLFGYLAFGAYGSVITSVQGLREGADRMAAGDLATPIVLQTRDELRGVADSFNHMAQELLQRNAQLQTRDATLAQLTRDYESEHPKAMLAAVIPALTHDLNTPISNAQLAASTLRDSYRAFKNRLDHDTLRRSDLTDFVNDLQQGLEIIEQSTQRAADLTLGLKNFSIDQASERRRSFALKQLVQEVLLTLSPTLRGAHWQVQTDIPDALQMDSYPGPLGQVLLNLVQNAAHHAFEGLPQGLLQIRATAVGADSLRIELQDNGRGMSAQTLDKLFTPFFTTRSGQGGSGVGLTYARRLVTNTLGGTLQVASTEGAGSTFTLELPRQAPDKG